MNLIKVITVYLYNIKEFLKADSMLTIETISEKLILFINVHYKKILQDHQDSSELFIRK